jgi:hypothetical protein
MTREEMRMAFWSDVFTTKLSDHLEQDALIIADKALAEFDKRFAPSQPEQVSMPVHYIKETGELGMTLNTERPWIKCEDKEEPPIVVQSVEVMFIDGTTDFGWIGCFGNWFSKQSSKKPLSNTWDLSHKRVIAWRELSTKTEE